MAAAPTAAAYSERKSCGGGGACGRGVPGEEGGATGGGEGRPVAAAPRDGEVEGEAAAAKAEGREASLNTELLASFGCGCAWARRAACGFGRAWGRG